MHLLAAARPLLQLQLAERVLLLPKVTLGGGLGGGLGGELGGRLGGGNVWQYCRHRSKYCRGKPRTVGHSASGVELQVDLGCTGLGLGDAASAHREASAIEAAGREAVGNISLYTFEQGEIAGALGAAGSDVPAFEHIVQPVAHPWVHGPPVPHMHTCECTLYSR